MTTALTPLGAEEAARAAQDARAIVEQLGHVVLGQDAAVRDAVAALIARGHVLLEGVPGTAKTLLVRALSQVLSLEFRRIQFTPDLMPSDITGVNLLTGAGTFTFRPGPIFGDLVLGDEINRAPAKTQAALLEAMQERRVTVDGVSHALPEGFTVFATQNPIEFEGTYPLPEAELDRFLVKVIVGYPGGAGGAGDPAAGARGLRGRHPGELRRTAGGGRRGPAAAARRLPQGSSRDQPGGLRRRDRARDPGRAGPHARRVAPGQRRAAQDGAGLGAARGTGVRDSRRREGARARRCSATG